MSTMRWQPAGFYRPHRDGLLCTLCPHACMLADGEIGLCQVRRRNGSRLETATFATSVRHWDSVERKPFYHYRPGRKVLTLAAPGCSFTCLYCQN
jgi:pyruvate formate lyase activating enzyme